MATSTATTNTSLISKSDFEPNEGQHRRQTVDEKEKKLPVRNVTQPAGTIVYTVDKNDTLTSIAARFETTPSELVKINRLVNRLIFPGKHLFVPWKFADCKDIPNITSPENCPEDLGKTNSYLPNGSGVFSSQGSPKPGHVERIQSPPLSPRLGPLETQTEEVVDRIHTQKFLKINVKHITDGQGVVSGVLLVTPNAVMFDPSVVDTLVMEHGADKYGVIAPMDYVANAALYTDIAHMRVKHAKQNALPHPEIYHAKSCPMYKGLGTESEASDVVVGQPSRSESQQAVKGSVSDKAELSDEDDDDEGDDDGARGGDDAFGGSVCSCHTGSKGSAVQTPDDNSEVFVEDDTSVFSENPKLEITKRDLEKIEERKTLASSTNVSFDSMETEAGLKKEFLVDRVLSDNSETFVETPVIGCAVESAQKSDLNATEVFEPVSVVIVVDETNKVDDELPNGQLPLVTDTNTKESVSGHSSLVPFFVESLRSLSQSAPVLGEEGGPQIPVGRKHSIPEAQTSTEKLRLKMLKRLSYPLWSTDSYESKGKEDLEMEGSIPVPKSLDSGQTTISKILTSASPRNLVDFSTGIFLKSADCVGKVADVSQLPKLPPSWIAPPSPSLDGWVETTKNLLTGQRGSTSPDASDVCEARNYNVIDYGLYGSKMDGKRVSRGSKEETRVEFKNEVADKLELFQTLEKLIPRPARSCEDPPLYLCLRMGSPLYKKVMSTTPIMSYGQHKMKSEYWFSIPKDRVDDLYRFFQHWAPGVYGDINQVDLNKRGFKLVEPDDDDDQSDDEDSDLASKSNVASFVKDSKENDEHDTAGNELHSWEIIKAPYQKLFGRLRRETQSSDSEVVSILDVPEQDDMRQMSLDLDMLIPELLGPTEIMDEEHRRSISKSLPARAQGYAWSLIFSASQHGFSLQSMYRRMGKFETPVLLVIQDTNNNVFGAVTSCTLKVSDHFYGTGESFLYTFYPEFKVFKWTGENVFFIKGNPESLAIGAGDGVFGLWLDGDLYHGRSHSCKTYNNDMLTSCEDFCVKTLEAWGFVEFGVMDSNC